MLVEGKLLPPLDLLLGVVESLLDHLSGLTASFVESFFQDSQTGCVNEKEVAVNLVVVDFLSALDINIKKANLHIKTNTFPRFMMSISLPLWVP